MCWVDPWVGLGWVSQLMGWVGSGGHTKRTHGQLRKGYGSSAVLSTNWAVEFASFSVFTRLMKLLFDND